MTKAAVVAFAVAVLVAAACGDRISVSTTAHAKHGHFFVDSSGRVRLFHGVNAVYKIAPWLPSMGEFDATTTLNDKDASDLAAWGFNVVRLGVMWPGVEPERGKYDMSYLVKAREMVDMLGRHGIYTIVDFHQDLLNRKLCGEGIPDWATIIPTTGKRFPAPVVNNTYPIDSQGYPELASCLQKSFGNYYFSFDTNAAFQNFYENKDGTRDSFAEFWRLVAKTFAGSEDVLGYEIINEPWAGDVYKHPTLLIPGRADKQNLWPLYEQANKAIRDVDDKAIVFFEKSMTNVLGPLGFPSGPGGPAYNDRLAYSFHNYCGTVDRTGNPKSFMVCEGEQEVQWLQAMHDIDSMNCGSMATEFGAVSGNNTKALQDLEWLLNHADKYLQSWAYWQYKSYNDITTASNERESFYWANGKLQEDKVDVLARPYAQAISGIPKSHTYDRKNMKFTMTYEASKALASKPTDVYLGKMAKRGFGITITPAGAATWEPAADANHILIYHSPNLADNALITVTIASH